MENIILWTSSVWFAVFLLPFYAGLGFLYLFPVSLFVFAVCHCNAVAVFILLNHNKLLGYTQINKTKLYIYIRKYFIYILSGVFYYSSKENVDDVCFSNFVHYSIIICSILIYTSYNLYFTYE